MNNKSLQNIVPEYHSGNPLIRDLFQARVAKAISVSNVEQVLNTSVLDAGCGEGLLLKELHYKCPSLNLTGIDIHPNTLSLKSQLPSSINILQSSLENTSFCDQQFDIIFCLDVLEHLEDLERVSNELMRLLSKNGKLIISAPTETFFYRLGRFISKGTWSEVDGPGAGQHYWDAYSLDFQLQKNGFHRDLLTKIPSIIGLDLFHINVYSVV